MQPLLLTDNQREYKTRGYQKGVNGSYPELDDLSVIGS